MRELRQAVDGAKIMRKHLEEIFLLPGYGKLVKHVLNFKYIRYPFALNCAPA